jgi:hypothetical protein
MMWGGVPWPQLDPAALHGLAGDVVAAVDPHTEADPVAVLMHFLAGFGAALGPGPHCRVGLDRHPLRVWAVLVGATAKGRKGSAWAAVRNILERADPTFINERVLSGLSTGEGLIWAVRDAITGRERVRENGETQYRDVEIDPGVSDKRLLALEEEFTSVLKVLAREGNTLSPILRQAWDRGSLRTLTKHSPARATGAHIVVVGHAVAEEVRRYLAETEMARGFSNRFLWLCVRRSKCLPRGGIPDEGALHALGEHVRAALERGRQVGAIEWSPAAGALWDELYPELSGARPGLVGAATARLEAHALRLAGLYAILNAREVIEPDDLKAAVAVVDYAAASARWLFGDALGDPMADAILQILQREGPLSRTELHARLGRHTSAARRVHALRTLQAAGLVNCELVETAGRRAEVWRACRP